MALLGLARGGDVKVRLGSDTFNAGRADHMAERIASDGPFLLPDLSGGSRDLYLNHVGGAPDVGWVAFAARPEGSTRDCFVEWKPDSTAFVDTCTGRSYPPDGAGLEQFPVAVTDGDVIVDINRTAEREAQPRPVDDFQRGRVGHPPVVHDHDHPAPHPSASTRRPSSDAGS